MSEDDTFGSKYRVSHTKPGSYDFELKDNATVAEHLSENGLMLMSSNSALVWIGVGYIDGGFSPPLIDA